MFANFSTNEVAEFVADYDKISFSYEINSRSRKVCSLRNTTCRNKHSHSNKFFNYTISVSNSDLKSAKNWHSVEPCREHWTMEWGVLIKSMSQSRGNLGWRAILIIKGPCFSTGNGSIRGSLLFSKRFSVLEYNIK